LFLDDPEKENPLLLQDDSGDEDYSISPRDAHIETASPRARPSRPRFRMGSLLSPHAHVEVLGQNDLTPDELETVMGLEELKHVHKIKVDRAAHVNTACVMRSSVYFLTPFNMNGEAMLPTVIKIKGAESARKEREAMKKAAEHFKHFAMIFKDFNENQNIGVLQLEISGSRCCIPRFVSAVEKTRELGQKFTEAITEAENGNPVQMDKVLTMVNEICLAVLKPCVKNTLKSHVEHSFMQTMDGKKVKTRLLGPVGEGTKFGPPYFDGHVVVEKYGGVLSDQMLHEQQHPETPPPDILLELMENATGQRVLPSEFFQAFFNAMEGRLSKLVLKTLKGVVHNDLHFGNVMVDADDRLWIIDCEDIGEGHVFTDLAKILAFGLFALPKDLDNPGEEQTMRRIMQLLASVPEQNFHEKALPRAPETCPPVAEGMWRFAWLMQRQFAQFSTWLHPEDEGYHRAFTMDKPHLQMLWAVFTEAVKMVTYKQNADFPKRKRLALFLAASIAARIQHEVAGRPKPSWLEKHEHEWSSAKEELEPRFTTSARERYSFLIHAKEAWVRDPFTHQKFDVLKDTVQLTLQRLVQPDDSQPIFLEARPTGYEEVARLLMETQRLLVVGSAGSGKTILTKQLITYMLNESVAGERLPIRIPLIDLWGLTTGDNASIPASELLSLYIKVNLEESVARIVETARHSKGLILIMDGLDEAEEKEWINDFVLGMQKESHLMLITTRPSAIETNPRFADNPLARWWRGSRVVDRVKFAQESVKEWGFSVCEIKEFGTKQLTVLAESRLGSELAKEIQDDMLQPAYRELVRVPLLATMMMHMIVQQLASPEREELTHCDVIQFAFEQLLLHIDVAKRREPKEFGVLEKAEKNMYELAYKKQSTRSKTIQLTDLTDSTDEVVRRNGQAIWKLGRSGQLALFEVCGDHLQFFHLMIQEYLAAVHVFTLLERGEKFPMWLHDEDEFALGTHHFFGALCAQRSFGIKAYIDEAEAASVRGNLLRLLRRAFVVNDRFAIEGLFNLFKLMRIDKFQLDLSGRQLNKVDQIGRGLKKLTTLEVLDLNLKYCTLLTRVTALGRAFPKLTAVRVLKLDFTCCCNMKALDGFADGLSHLICLRELDLGFSECHRLQRVDELGVGLPHLVSLVSLRLDFSQCERLLSLAEVGRSVATLTGLTKFALDVSYCSALDSLDDVGRGLAKLGYNLQHMRIFANHTKVQMDEVCKGMSKLPHLRYLSADWKVYGTYFSARNLITGRWRMRHICIFTLAYAVEQLRALIIFVIILCQFIVLIVLDKF